MIKIYDSNDNIIELNDSFSMGESSFPLVKELLNREDYTSYSFTIGESEERISMSDVFVLQINIKDSSSVFSAFKVEKFPKDEIINKIALLKDIVVNDVESSKHKTSELLKILKEYNPYFIIYQSKNGIPLRSNELQELLNELEMNEISLIYLERVASSFGQVVPKKEEPKVEEIKEEEPAPLEETSQPEEQVEETPVTIEETVETVEKSEEPTTLEEVPVQEEKPVKEKKPKKERKKVDLKKYVVMDIGNIKKNKYHFIFLTVSSFLFGFASSVGFCNAMLLKGISALFFVCAGVGIFLNTYIYVDYLKERTLKDRMFVYSVLFNLIGFGLSIGATFIFYSLDKGEIKNNIDAGLLTWVSVVMSVSMIILSVAIASLIDFIERKVRAKKAKENEGTNN